MTFSDGQRGIYRLATLSLTKMGRVNAATATADAIHRWQPRFVLLVGIAGGVSAQGVALGDVLVSDQIVDYELQKLLPDGPEVRYEVHRADQRLLDAAANFADPGWPALDMPRRPRKGQPTLWRGPIATGDKVDAAGVLNRYRGAWPKLIGIEIEAGGAADASFQSALRPGFFMIRGVSDLADSHKDSSSVGRWRKYACAVAAGYAVALLRSGPVPLDPHAPAADAAGSPLTIAQQAEIHEGLHRGLLGALIDGLEATLLPYSRSELRGNQVAPTLRGQLERDVHLAEVLETLPGTVEEAGHSPDAARRRIAPAVWRGLAAFARTPEFDMVVRQVYAVFLAGPVENIDLQLDSIRDEYTALLSLHTGLAAAQSSRTGTCPFHTPDAVVQDGHKGLRFDRRPYGVERKCQAESPRRAEGPRQVPGIPVRSDATGYQGRAEVRGGLPPAGRRATQLDQATSLRRGPQIADRPDLRPSFPSSVFRRRISPPKLAGLPPVCRRPGPRGPARPARRRQVDPHAEARLRPRDAHRRAPAGRPAPTPVLVILRDYGAERKERKCSLLEFIEQTANITYQLKPPPGSFEYLLHGGRLAIIFDGLDELLDTSFRQQIGEDIELFCTQYPAVPLLVTSREVGYDQAPLRWEKFDHYRLAPFADEQVKEYVARWFDADVNLTDDQKRRKAEGFVGESKNIADLRSNPLMLALLCNIYRGEGYIPQNRPAVYEKCATMLFERWDKDRSLQVRLKIEDKIRPAMMYLAHWIYTDKALQGGVTEEALVRRVVEYLVPARFEDRDVADQAAREFVAFCRGRAWVFTDTGVQKGGESLYQFTHRTFLEYFAAGHLARTHETAAALGKVLLPRIARKEWDIVAQLAIQIKELTAEGAADQILATLVKESRQANTACREHPRIRHALPGVRGAQPAARPRDHPEMRRSLHPVGSRSGQSQVEGPRRQRIESAAADRPPRASLRRR